MSAIEAAVTTAHEQLNVAVSLVRDGENEAASVKAQAKAQVATAYATLALVEEMRHVLDALESIKKRL